MLHGGELYGKTIEHDFSVNLNPHPSPASIRLAIEEAARKVSEYPDMRQRAFREAVAASEPENIAPANVIGGNGASGEASAPAPITIRIEASTRK